LYGAEESSDEEDSSSDDEPEVQKPKTEVVRTVQKKAVTRVQRPVIVVETVEEDEQEDESDGDEGGPRDLSEVESVNTMEDREEAGEVEMAAFVDAPRPLDMGVCGQM